MTIYIKYCNFNRLNHHTFYLLDSPPQKKIMKKELLFCFILLSTSLLFSSPNDSEKVTEDLISLKTYLTQCWVGYDDAVKKGFDIDKCIKKINLDYKLTKNKNKEAVYYNGINNNAMSSAISKNLAKYLPTENRDGHFSISNEKEIKYIYPKIYQFYTNIYLEQKDGKYVVCKSDMKEIPVGSIYTDNLENILPWIENDKQIFRIGIKQAYYYKTAKVNFNDKDFEVPLSFIYNFNQVANHLGYLDTENTIYVSLSDCFLASENKIKHEELENDFKEIIDKISNNNHKKNLILDLRGNYGGFRDYPAKILSAYFYGNNSIKANSFYDYLKVFDYGSIKLDSPEIAKKQYEYAVENEGFPTSWIDNAFEHYQELLNAPKRVYTGLEFLPMGQLPQIKTKNYNGKVIILMDIQTSSAAEYGIALSYFENENSVILVGDKTNGAIDFGGLYTYVLPNSKVKISLCTIDNRKIAAFAHNSHWHGDSLGFYPDYYATDENLMDTIVYITQDKDLSQILNGIENNLK